LFLRWELNAEQGRPPLKAKRLFPRQSAACISAFAISDACRAYAMMPIIVAVIFAR
jgi:hypothetical protein